MAADESSVVSPAPGWARKIPRDERVFMWLVAVSLVVLTVFVLGWLAWGKQNVPSDFAYMTPKEFSAKVAEQVGRFQASDGGVYVPPGEDAYLSAGRYAFYPELTLQENTRYTIWLSATDVLHGFSLVGGGQNINLMMVPNHVTKMNLTVGSAGRYLIVCNEYCGLQHHQMKGHLNVVSAAEMERGRSG